MPAHAPIYDLVLLLSTGASEDQRAKILKDVDSAISKAKGSVERNDDWGTRPLAYQIGHRPDAEYHLLQFSGPAALIEELSHTLGITDGVIRFRIIKVRPGTPPAPDTPPPVVATASAAARAAPAAAGEPVPAAAPARPEEPAVAEAPEPAEAQEPAEAPVPEGGAEPAEEAQPEQ